MADGRYIFLSMEISGLVEVSVILSPQSNTIAEQSNDCLCFSSQRRNINYCLMLMSSCAPFSCYLSKTVMIIVTMGRITHKKILIFYRVFDRGNSLATVNNGIHLNEFNED